MLARISRVYRLAWLRLDASRDVSSMRKHVRNRNAPTARNFYRIAAIYRTRRKDHARWCANRYMESCRHGDWNTFYDGFPFAVLAVADESPLRHNCVLRNMPDSSIYSNIHLNSCAICFPLSNSNNSINRPYNAWR